MFAAGAAELVGSSASGVVQSCKYDRRVHEVHESKRGVQGHVHAHTCWHFALMLCSSGRCEASRSRRERRSRLHACASTKDALLSCWQDPGVVYSALVCLCCGLLKAGGRTVSHRWMAGGQLPTAQDASVYVVRDDMSQLAPDAQGYAVQRLHALLVLHWPRSMLLMHQDLLGLPCDCGLGALLAGHACAA